MNNKFDKKQRENLEKRDRNELQIFFFTFLGEVVLWKPVVF